METLSPMAVDVEMESPRGQSEDLLIGQEEGMTDAPALADTLYFMLLRWREVFKRQS